jgi:lysophospholipase L1-like esterase
MRVRRVKTVAIAAILLGSLAVASPSQAASRWVESWTTAAQAPYPAGYEVGQPGNPRPLGPNATGPLLTHAFPQNVARQQTMRMIVHPSIGGRRWRLRLTNVFGTQPVTFGQVRVAVQAIAGTTEPGTSRPLTFSGRRSVTVAAGKQASSDPVRLRLAARPTRNLAVSLFVRGTSGPMTWHAASFATSYVTDPGAGDHTADTSDEGFPHSTTSWFFLSGLEVRRPDAATVVAFGDSITDGFFSSINGDDRWPDDLQRRLIAREKRDGLRLSVVNQGIAGNMVTGIGRLPGGCTPCDGPGALVRLRRDLLRLSNVRVAILLEGINDIGGGGAGAQQVIDGMKEFVRRAHARGIKVIGATITPSAGTDVAGLENYGTAETDARRRAVNDFIRNSGTFDGVADFSAATEDPSNPGHLRPEFDVNSAVGGPGDHLHPNRAGFLAMARSINLGQLERFARTVRSGSAR